MYGIMNKKSNIFFKQGHLCNGGKRTMKRYCYMKTDGSKFEGKEIMDYGK